MRVVRLYRLLLGLLPPAVQRSDRAEMADTLAVLHAEAESFGRRARVLAVSFGRLPAVIVLEWLDHIGTASRARSRRKGERMHGIWSGARHGVRSLARTPSFTVSAVVLLGVGIGAVTSIFSVVDHVVLRPLPYPAAERLVKVENGAHSGLTFGRLETLESIEEWAGVDDREAILTGGDEPLQIREGHVTRDFFSLFGARPAVGRLFVDSDVGGGDAVVLSHGLWQRVWGGDPDVVGRTIRIDGAPRVVIGVLAEDFVAPEGLEAGGIDTYRTVDWTVERYSDDSYHVLSVAGRLRADVPLERARAEAEALAARRAEAAPDRFVTDDGSVLQLPLTPLRDATVGGVRAGLGLIFGAVTLLLLVACVNVAHLFMARGVERRREMSVRRALGAATPALARQLGVESLVVGLAGAGVGVALAAAAVGAFQAAAAGSLPRMDTIGVDLRMLAFAAGVGMATALGFGLLPALRLAGRGTESPLRLATRGSTAGRGAQTVRNGLVVVEVALSLVLAAQAGWLIHSFSELHATDLGFQTADIWTLPLALTGIESPGEWSRRVEGMRASLEEVPGVRSATFGLTAPLQHVGGNSCCWRTNPLFEGDDPADPPERPSMVHPVDPAFFDVFGLRTVAGRTWTRAEESAIAASVARSEQAAAEEEGAGPSAGAAPEPAGPVGPVVLSEPLAVRVFGAADRAPGRSVTLGARSFTVVGVVADNRHYGPDREHGNAIYIPAAAIPFGPGRASLAVAMESPQAANREGLPRELAEAVWRAEPEVPVPTIRSMSDWAERATARARFVSGLFTAFGAVALLLVAGGLAGTLLYTVRVRRRELGIRLALGATPASVEGSVLGRGVTLTGAGILLGGVAAWMSGRLLEGLVAGAEARHAGAFGISVAVLLSVALLASWLPARRAGKTDPIETLRVD